MLVFWMLSRWANLPHAGAPFTPWCGVSQPIPYKMEKICIYTTIFRLSLPLETTFSLLDCESIMTIWRPGRFGAYVEHFINFNLTLT